MTPTIRLRLVAHLAELSVPELHALAAQVVAWRLLLQGGEYDATRTLLVELMAQAHEEYSRRWRNPKYWPHQFTADSPWGRVYADAEARAAKARIAADGYHARYYHETRQAVAAFVRRLEEGKE